MDDVGAGIDSGDDDSVVGFGPLSLARRVVPNGFGVDRGDHFVATGQGLPQCLHGVASRQLGLGHHETTLGSGSLPAITLRVVRRGSSIATAP